MPVNNPRTTTYEFMGPFGAIMIPIALPLVIYALYFVCRDPEHCSLEVPQLPELHTLFSLDAAAVVLAWFLFQAFLYVTVPGPVAKGLPLRTGDTLTYKLNGLACFVLSFAAVLFGVALDIFRLEYLHKNYIQLATASILLSYAISIFLYVKSMAPGALWALGGNSGNFFYDFFIGRELNPRTGDFDWKYFCELRPGLMGWALLNFGNAAAQYQQFGHVTLAMWFVCLVQFYYVLDAFINEKAILSTMDITQDGFGFMLAFGDLAWVPFTYTLQTRYLAGSASEMPVWHIALVLLTQAVGFYIFRSANSQKDTFRSNPNDPSVAHLKTLPTQRGTRLLISGWWGMSRHMNYFGDLLMGLAWCLPCGFSHIIPYFYFFYFAVLLIHRADRDDHACHIKYGKDWDEYKRIVKYRIVPYVF
eukprot:m.62944 g.62944  ORF g.62944 m.62944 type:complete len:418 (+) comp13819_c0_seq2:119-1372(+)